MPADSILNSAFTALADRYSRMIVEQLAQQGPLTTTTLAQLLNCDMDAVQHRVTQLRTVGLIGEVTNDTISLVQSGFEELQTWWTTNIPLLKVKNAREPSHPPEETEPDALDIHADAWAREWPHLDRDTFLIGRRLLRLSDHVQAGLKTAAASEGLQGTELLLLDALLAAEDPYMLTPTQLQSSLLLTKGGVTKCISRLEAVGLVQRLPDPNDGRGVLVQMMPTARELLRRIIETGNVGTDWVASGQLQPQQRAQLSYLLCEMLHLADAEAGRRHAKE